MSADWDAQRMPLARISGTIFFFVHVPKCGGTSIKHYLESVGNVALDGRGGKIEWSRCTADHIHAEIYDRLVPEDFYDYGFILFRDPVERLKSEFRMFARPPFRSLNPINWVLSGVARLRGRPIYTYQFLNCRWLVDPDLWAYGALWISRIMPYRGNNHYRPQVSFWREGLKPFFLQDGLEKVVRWIDEKAQLPEQAGSVPHEVPRVESQQRQPRVDNITFSPATERFIRRFYAEDYALIDRLRSAEDLS
ncbi:hypothetical protein [Roseovarius sp.]|uniref:hypothetical protein n=1 Tax=Roseovarius sp. TaxID=1486281 RepID=UPI003563938F